MSETVFKNEIKIGRLQKKIKKLLQQRDHYKEEYDLMVKMIKMYPMLRHDYSKHLERQVEQRRVVALDKRVQEQELLIRLLVGDAVKPYDIQKAYEKIVAEKYAKLDESQKYKKMR